MKILYQIKMMLKKDQFYENDNNEIAINKKVEDIRNKKI